MLLSPRRLFFGTSAALILAALALGAVTKRMSVTISARNRATIAAGRLDATLASGGENTRALALSYLERARLGMGSPFRLIEQAIRDPRLADSVGRDVAWSIVDRIFDGRAYEIDPRALDGVSRPGAGAGHLAIIERAVADADDPRVGEASVRLAYALAASSGAASLNSLALVAEAAAQARDRALVTADLHAAVARAQRDQVDLLTEIVKLRASRELRVEQPLLARLVVDERDEAISAAPELLERIAAVSPASDELRGPSPLLDPPAAMALAKLAAKQPPLAAVRVPVTGRASTLRADPGLTRAALAVIGSAANEESLVAAFAYADRASEGRSTALPRLIVSAAVALRAHAQDRVWFPGDAAVSSGAVIGRFGLKTIAFDRDVPGDWRPFYTQMIASALEDFQRVVPGYDPAGLSFRVETRALPDSSLAMHDPRTHTIRLSAMTPSGTLAHELAHDVDWRAARRLFATSGGYATDRSMREQGIRLASSVRGLTSARVAGRGRISPRGSGRPAEVFARSVDWFVADALAAMGRSNGFLSAIEDPVLTGFAAIPADAPALGASKALVGTLSEMSWVPDSVAQGFVGRWSSLDALDPSTVVARTMDVPVYTRRAGRVPFGMTAALIEGLKTGMLCRVDAMRDGSSQDRLLTMAIDARARGIVARSGRSGPAYAGADADLRLITAAVAEGFSRAGLFELAPAPFRPLC